MYAQLRLTYGGEGSGVLRCAVRASVLARENLSKELISPLAPARRRWSAPPHSHLPTGGGRCAAASGCPLEEATAPPLTPARAAPPLRPLHHALATTPATP